MSFCLQNWIWFPLQWRSVRQLSQRWLSAVTNTSFNGVLLLRLVQSLLVPGSSLFFCRFKNHKHLTHNRIVDPTPTPEGYRRKRWTDGNICRTGEKWSKHMFWVTCWTWTSPWHHVQQVWKPWKLAGLWDSSGISKNIWVEISPLALVTAYYDPLPCLSDSSVGNYVLRQYWGVSVRLYVALVGFYTSV